MKIAHLKTYNRLYIIGDIHGSIELLLPLIEYLVLVDKITEKDQVVFLGDYIDRGKDSKAVIEELLLFKASFKNTVFLRGNHEDMFLSYLGFDGCYGESFHRNGGSKTLEDYGIYDYLPRADLLKQLPKKHVEFFRNLSDMALTKNLLCVHAGVDITEPLEEQKKLPTWRDGEDTIFWLRDRFYCQCTSVKEPYLGRTIVHGHTIQPEVSFKTLPMRLNIDTGSYRENGKISCLVANEADISKSKIIQSDRKKGIKVL